MPVVTQTPQVELTGLRRGGVVRGALVVLSGATPGDLKRASALSGVLCDKCLLVAVDGGLKTCRAARRVPDLFVGDVDSTNRVPRGLNSVVYPTDKDFSDLAGALGEVKKRRAQIVIVAGLLGGRLDHEWANLQELGVSAKRFAGILAPTPRGVVVITGRGFRAVTTRRRLMSVLPLGGAAVVTLKGVRWGLSRRLLRPGSVGLSNITGKHLHVTVHKGSVAVVFPAVR